MGVGSEASSEAAWRRRRATLLRQKTPAARAGRRTWWPEASARAAERLPRAIVFVVLVVFLAACAKRSSAPNARATVTPASPASSSTEPSPTPPEPPDEPALAEVGSFDRPLYVTAPAGDSRLFVVEKTGRVRIFAGGQVKPNAFLDLSREVSNGSEQGLLSIAFAPDYSFSGLVYADYTDRKGDTRVVEYKVSSDPDRIDPATRREILFVDQPFANHNGGLLIFDRLGVLIVGMGDGGSGGDPSNRAQDLSSLLGKLLRIDARNPAGGRPYGIPSDNPFVSRASARPEIWAYGLRNPWRFSLEPATGDLYLGDVGQNRVEEIDYVPADKIAGANFGWRVFEGNLRYTSERLDVSQTIQPVIVYPLDGTCAVTGGFLYRGEVNTLRGAYLYGDYCAGFVKSFRLSGGAVVDPKEYPALATPELSSFGEDGFGQLYITSLAGKVYRVTKK